MRIFKKILLVDDDEVCNYLSQEIITNMELVEDGIEVVTNGKAVLNYFNQHSADECPYELILLDIHMPVLAGFEVLDKINEEYAQFREKTKIVILTSSSSGDDMENLRTKRIDGYIVKPLTEKKLSEIVKML